MTPSEERHEWLARKPNPALYNKLRITAWVLTVVIFIVVGLMRQPELKIPLPDGVSTGILPPIHALINVGVSVFLIAAFVAVKRGRIRLHSQLMGGAMVLSVLFLLGYVAYHFTTPETLFGDADGDGVLSLEELQDVRTTRPIYMVILITHILAAGISLPLILLTFSAAWANLFGKHRALAKWVFPIWLYVAITGPICYLMLRNYYP